MNTKLSFQEEKELHAKLFVSEEMREIRDKVMSLVGWNEGYFERSKWKVRITPRSYFTVHDAWCAMSEAADQLIKEHGPDMDITIRDDADQLPCILPGSYRGQTCFKKALLYKVKPGSKRVSEYLAHGEDWAILREDYWGIKTGYQRAGSLVRVVDGHLILMECSGEEVKFR